MDRQVYFVNGLVAFVLKQDIRWNDSGTTKTVFKKGETYLGRGLIDDRGNLMSVSASSPYHNVDDLILPRQIEGWEQRTFSSFRLMPDWKLEYYRRAVSA